MTGKAIIFDASTLISMSMNGLLRNLERLKEEFNGKFIITKEVKDETIDRPMKTKRFELEALRVKELLDSNVLEMPESLGIDSSVISKKAKEMINMANEMFVSHKKEIKLIHLGEASCLALGKLLDKKDVSYLIALDERTARMLCEKPNNLEKLLTKKMHTKVKLRKKHFDYFKDFKIIRSTELMYVAWKKNLFEIQDGKILLDAILYALKFKGCAISKEEIKEIKGLK